MPKVTAKRQITLPVTVCRELGIEPGDDVAIFAHDGRITILKQYEGAAKGILSGVKADSRYIDEESRDSALELKHKPK